MTPFQALYGKPPLVISGYTPRNTKIEKLDEILTQRTDILKLLKENLTRAQNHMVQQANKHRSEKVFESGQWVYLKLQPYRQVSLKNRHSQKLAKRFYGPFRILRRIGTVAYELELPPAARIHPVFHVSLLKTCHGDPKIQVLPLPLTTSDTPLQLEAL